MSMFKQSIRTAALAATLAVAGTIALPGTASAAVVCGPYRCHHAGYGPRRPAYAPGHRPYYWNHRYWRDGDYYRGRYFHDGYWYAHRRPFYRNGGGYAYYGPRVRLGVSF